MAERSSSALAGGTSISTMMLVPSCLLRPRGRMGEIWRNFLEILLHYQTEYKFHFSISSTLGSVLLDRINVVLIGAGRMGQVHGPNAAHHPGLHLKYVVDPRPAAVDFAAAFGAELVSLEHALADPSVGGVLICSTTDQHLGHALAAVGAGKAVFCEKPIDLDLEKVRAAQERFADARFLLGFNRRFDPQFVRLKQQLDTGAVGKLETLHLVNHDPAAPPPGFIPTSGGLFKDFTIHDLDMARWLLGEEPVEVYASANWQRDRKSVV